MAASTPTPSQQPAQQATQQLAWQAHVLTLFPDMFPGALAQSLAGKALVAGRWSLTITDIRQFGIGKHRKTDDTPFGGGAGMIMRADVLAAALAHAEASVVAGCKRIYLSPRGIPFTQTMAQDLAEAAGVMLVCGRYEGVDQRIIDAAGLLEVSIGDYVLSGGELAAQVLLDGVVRLLPGVMGNLGTITEESFADGLLEYPQYTQPRLWQGQSVPQVLLSGDHAKIAQWRQAEAEAVTKARRADLWQTWHSKSKIG